MCTCIPACFRAPPHLRIFTSPSIWKRRQLSFSFPLILTNRPSSIPQPVNSECVNDCWLCLAQREEQALLIITITPAVAKRLPLQMALSGIVSSLWGLHLLFTRFIDEYLGILALNYCPLKIQQDAACLCSTLFDA